MDHIATPPNTSAKQTFATPRSNWKQDAMVMKLGFLDERYGRLFGHISRESNRLSSGRTGHLANRLLRACVGDCQQRNTIDEKAGPSTNAQAVPFTLSSADTATTIEISDGVESDRKHQYVKEEPVSANATLENAAPVSPRSLTASRPQPAVSSPVMVEPFEDYLCRSSTQSATPHSSTRLSDQTPESDRSRSPSAASGDGAFAVPRLYQCAGNPNRLACTHCQYTCSHTQPVRFIEHVTGHARSPPGAFECTECDWSCDSASALSTHSRSSHINTSRCSSKNIDKEPGLNKVKAVSSQSNSLVCPHCPYRTGNKSEFKSHSSRHGTTPSGMFGCRYCDYWSVKAPGVKSHETLHQKQGELPKDSVSVVPKPPTKSVVKPDKNVVKSDRKQKSRRGCTECGATCVGKANMMAHMECHGRNPPARYLCRYCNFSTEFEASRQSHERMHQARMAQKKSALADSCSAEDAPVKQKSGASSAAAKQSTKDGSTPKQAKQLAALNKDERIRTSTDTTEEQPQSDDSSQSKCVSDEDESSDTDNDSDETYTASDKMKDSDSRRSSLDDFIAEDGEQSSSTTSSSSDTSDLEEDSGSSNSEPDEPHNEEHTKSTGNDKRNISDKNELKAGLKRPSKKWRMSDFTKDDNGESIEDNNEEVTNPCPICQAEMGTQTAGVQRHVSKHGRDRPFKFQCRYCDYSDDRVLTQHEQMHERRGDEILQDQGMVESGCESPPPPDSVEKKVVVVVVDEDIEKKKHGVEELGDERQTAQRQDSEKQKVDENEDVDVEHLDEKILKAQDIESTEDSAPRPVATETATSPKSAQSFVHTSTKVKSGQKSSTDFATLRQQLIDQLDGLEATLAGCARRPTTTNNADTPASQDDFAE